MPGILIALREKSSFLPIFHLKTTFPPMKTMFPPYKMICPPLKTICPLRKDSEKGRMDGKKTCKNAVIGGKVPDFSRHFPLG
jgi:hypothetical protein